MFIYLGDLFMNHVDNPYLHRKYKSIAAIKKRCHELALELKIKNGVENKKEVPDSIKLFNEGLL